MKGATVSILMFLLFTQTFSKWLILVEYQLNKELISERFCINKARPKLNCKGKCRMMKKIAEEEQQTTRGHHSPKKINLPDLCKDGFIVELPFCVRLITVLHRSNYFFPKYAAPLQSVFHPPAAC